MVLLGTALAGGLRGVSGAGLVETSACLRQSHSPLGIFLGGAFDLTEKRVGALLDRLGRLVILLLSGLEMVLGKVHTEDPG